MSIKIYTGFRLPGADLETALAAIQTLRAEIRSLARSEAATLLASRVSQLIDADATAAFTDRPRPEGRDAPLSHVARELDARSRKVEQSGLRDPEVDFQMEISLFARGGDTYGITHSERSAWIDRWMALSGAEAFRYWNNSDPEPGVSREDWAARGQLWNDLLGADPHHRPGYAGLCASIHEIRLPRVEIEEVLAAQPSLEDRARDLAVDHMRSRSLAQELGSDPSIATSRIIGAISRFDRWLKTEAGQAELGVIMAEVRDLLPRSLTRNILLRGQACCEADHAGV